MSTITAKPHSTVLVQDFQYTDLPIGTVNNALTPGARQTEFPVGTVFNALTPGARETELPIGTVSNAPLSAERAA